MKKITLMLVVVLAGLMVAPVFAAGAPVVYDDWGSQGGAAAECAQLGAYDFSFKVDDWDQENGMDGVYDSFITISNSDGYFFDWSSTHGIGAVIVKAGQGANVWFYDPQAYSDTGLYSYIDPEKEEMKEISHVTFCWNPEPPQSEWCSPGYWRQPQHADSWAATGFSPDDLFSAVFGYAPTLSKLGNTNGATADPTLLQVLSAPQYYGGEAFNLVGDKLSLAHPDVNFTGERVEDSCPLD